MISLEEFLESADDDLSVEYFVDVNDDSLDPAYEEDAAAIAEFERELRLADMIERLQSPVLMEQRYEKKLSQHR